MVDSTVLQTIQKYQKRLELTSSLFLPEFSRQDVVQMIFPLLSMRLQIGIINLKIKFEDLFDPLKLNKLFRQVSPQGVYTLLRIIDLIIRDIENMKFYVNRSVTKLI